MRHTSFLLLPLLVLALATGCGSDADTDNAGSGEPSFQREGTLAFYQPSGDTLATIAIEIADTDAERQQGLMRRRSLGYDRGMLFIFDDVSTDGMWMKNTPLPLDIVFVAPDSQVVSITRRTTPFSEETIEPAAPRKFVVEVRAGFANRYGLTDSTSIRWTRTQ
jgi:uncharacterized membrane protein (UPF0127 family)